MPSDSNGPPPESSWGLSTRCVWGGEGSPGPEGATVPPVYHGVTFAHDDLDQWRSVALGETPGHIYSRNTNPTTGIFEEKIRALEGAEAATSFATGMAAVSDTLSTLLEPGRRVVSITDTYGGANRIFNEFLPRIGVRTTLCPTHDHAAIEEEVARGCDVLYLETPTNPTLRIVDLAALSEAAHAVGALVVVDNTFATPINQLPLQEGADLVIYSATKFLGGHSDAMGGVVLGSEALVRPIFRYREINGASLDPMSAFLLTRGLKTLELRMERHNANARAVADFLKGHPAVSEVFYPGLPDHPGHEIARRQMSGFGGVLSFSLRDGERDPGDAGGSAPGNVGRADGLGGTVGRFLSRLRLAHRAASLGSVATLVGPPSTTSHVELSAKQRAAAGIPEGLIRYSTGIENPADLLADLAFALEGC